MRNPMARLTNGRLVSAITTEGGSGAESTCCGCFCARGLRPLSSISYLAMLTPHEPLGAVPPVQRRGQRTVLGLILASSGRFDLRNIDLLHRHHGLEHALCNFPVRIGEPLVEYARVICQENPQRSLHQPQALSVPPLPTIAFQ